MAFEIASVTPPSVSVRRLALGVVDRLALLKLWTEDTPSAIFPQRRIGFLRDGYEASFLALEGNPLEDWRNIRRIKLRFKQGLEVH